MADLSISDLTNRLRGDGLYLCIGPVVASVRTAMRRVIDGIALLYADYPLAESEDFADFHVRLDQPRNLRRWFNPQVLFYFDEQIPFKPLPAAQAFAMFEWCLNWCVSSHCHEYLIVHAAVIERHGCAMILPAPPGSGKSTLCAGLVARGWRLLSDELTLIDMATGLITGLPRPVSLKDQSIDVIRHFDPGAIIGQPAHDTTKGTVAHLKPPRQSVERWADRAEPAWIVFPKYVPKAPATLTLHAKGHTLIELAKNAFNYSLHGAPGFERLVTMIDRCRCCDFSYGDLDEAVRVFDELKPPERGALFA